MEDRQTRWAPDVIADVDLPDVTRRPRLDARDVRLLAVPKPDGKERLAPVLSGSALAALSNATELLRSVADDILDPAVCGYREGATGSTAYSEEYRRFREWAGALAQRARFVVVADVREFFASVTEGTMQRAIYDRFEDPSGTLSAFLSGLSSFGVQGLPAGYGDARLVANLVLAPVDEQIRLPFTRWVDDYRIFASTRHDAVGAVVRMRRALRDLDLELNDSKLRILEIDAYLSQSHGLPLDSVYHPQDEASEEVRANLRSVFLSSLADGDRRRLRFALPRLALEADPVAIPFALDALRRNSVDAPRLVAYLSRFTDDISVASAVEKMLRDTDVSDWILMRLFPLLCRIPLESPTLDSLAKRSDHSPSILVRGAVLRLMALQGRSGFVMDAMRSPARVDDRALLASCFDLDWECPDWLVSSSPDTYWALAHVGGAPLPDVESIL